MAENVARQHVINQADAVPMRKAPVKDIDAETKYLIQLRNVYRRQYQRTRDDEKKTAVNQLNKIIKSRLDILRNQESVKQVSRLGN